MLSAFGFLAFWVSFVTFHVGAWLFPAMRPTRGAAILGWASAWFSGIGMSYAELYWDYRQPWQSTTLTVLISWAILIIGLVIALLKPKRSRPVPS